VKLLLSHIWNNKLSTAIAVITLLFIAIDINERFLVNELSLQKNNSTIQAKGIIFPSVTDKNKQAISKAYKNYETVTDTKIEPKNLDGMTAEQQLGQNGELSALYVGDYKLKLKAIIYDQSKVNTHKSVLLQVTNMLEKTVVIEKFNPTNDVYGYQLKIVNNTKIELQKVNEQEVQAITLSMYSAAN